MVFYKGAVSYKELQEMPMPELFNLAEMANMINDAVEKETKRQMKRR